MNGGKRLTQETVLIVGLGEIGHTLFALLSEAKGSFAVYGFDLDEAKMNALGQSKDKISSKIDTMHVCLPCSNQEKFADVVAGYVDQFNPKIAIPQQYCSSWNHTKGC